MGIHLNLIPPEARFYVIGAILLLAVGFRVVPFLLNRNKLHTHLPLGAARDYGIAGGAVCPNCHRPVVFSLFELKLGFGTKFVRCEHCGKWSLMQRASLEVLHAAEAAELAEAQPAQPVKGKSEEEKIQERIDESRFTQ